MSTKRRAIAETCAGVGTVAACLGLMAASASADTVTGTARTGRATGPVHPAANASSDAAPDYCTATDHIYTHPTNGVPSRRARSSGNRVSCTKVSLVISYTLTIMDATTKKSLGSIDVDPLAATPYTTGSYQVPCKKGHMVYTKFDPEVQTPDGEWISPGNVDTTHVKCN